MAREEYLFLIYISIQIKIKRFSFFIYILKKSFEAIFFAKQLNEYESV